MLVYYKDVGIIIAAKKIRLASVRCRIPMHIAVNHMQVPMQKQLAEQVSGDIWKVLLI